MSELLYPYGFIYETTCIPTNMKYRGSHRRTQDPNDPDDSWYIGSSTNPQFWEDLEKYGLKNFKRIILEDVYEESRDNLKERECFYLKQVDAMHNPMYYNRTNSAWYGGGSTEGMKVMHKGDIEKFFDSLDIKSAESDGWVLGASDSHRTSNSKSQLGKTLTQVIRSKISQTLSLNNPMYDEGNRKKVAESKEGKIWINNGSEQTYVEEKDLEYFLDLGYSLGMLKRSGKTSKDYECHCKVCGNNYRGGKYSTMCKECYSEMKKEELRKRGGKF